MNTLPVATRIEWHPEVLVDSPRSSRSGTPPPPVPFLLEDDDSSASSTTSSELGQVDILLENHALKQMLKEKVKSCEEMRIMLFNSNHCQQMTICGLSKLISQQGALLEKNAEEMAKLNARFAADAPRVAFLLAAEDAAHKALDMLD